MSTAAEEEENEEWEKNESGKFPPAWGCHIVEDLGRAEIHRRIARSRPNLNHGMPGIL